MFKANNPADNQQLYETMPATATQILGIAKEYGYVNGDSNFHEPFRGNGGITNVLEEANVAYTAADKYTLPVSTDFYTSRSLTTAVVTNPPFKGIAEFFEIMAELGKLFFNSFIFILFLQNIFIFVGIAFFILAKFDALSAKRCIAAFTKMGGIDVHIIRPMPKFIRNGEVVGCETTAIFVGNIPARKGQHSGGYCTLFSAESELAKSSSNNIVDELEENLSDSASADEMEAEVDGGSVDSKGNVPGLIEE